MVRLVDRVLDGCVAVAAAALVPVVGATNAGGSHDAKKVQTGEQPEEYGSDDKELKGDRVGSRERGQGAYSKDH